MSLSHDTSSSIVKEKGELLIAAQYDANHCGREFHTLGVLLPTTMVGEEDGTRESVSSSSLDFGEGDEERSEAIDFETGRSTCFLDAIAGLPDVAGKPTHSLSAGLDAITRLVPASFFWRRNRLVRLRRLGLRCGPGFECDRPVWGAGQLRAVDHDAGHFGLTVSGIGEVVLALASFLGLSLTDDGVDAVLHVSAPALKRWGRWENRQSANNVTDHILCRADTGYLVSFRRISKDARMVDFVVTRAGLAVDAQMIFVRLSSDKPYDFSNLLKSTT